ncbi:MAG: precorrin-4 C(11)-methyltransferase [Clostridium sp.]
MVYFVGAGPGAVDLITVRGKNLIESADVIIYAGSLVNPKLLDYKKVECSVYNSASMTLDEVIHIINKSNIENKVVVRLHTGDPSIYGAIREQMDRLDNLEIEYEVVPGVSSFFGAAATLKKELTLPNVSQTVIITRMAGRTPVPEKEEIALLAAHKATMAIFLSTGLIDSLVERLVIGGYTLNTPAAIVYKATWDDEKKFIGTLGTLSNIASENNIKKTALIMVGEFLGNEYELSKLYDPSFSHEFRESTK